MQIQTKSQVDTRVPKKHTGPSVWRVLWAPIRMELPSPESCYQVLPKEGSQAEQELGNWVWYCLWEAGNSPSPELHLGLGWFLSLVWFVYLESWFSQGYKTWAVLSWVLVCSGSCCSEFHLMPLASWLCRSLSLVLTSSFSQTEEPQPAQLLPSRSKSRTSKIILCYSAFSSCNVLFQAWRRLELHTIFKACVDYEFSLLVSNNLFYFFYLYHIFLS